LCRVEKALVGVVVLVSTRGHAPRTQICSKTWHICQHCLPNIAARMDENSLLADALAEFEARVPKPRPTPPRIARLYEQIAEEGC